MICVQLAHYKAERATGDVLLAMQGVDHAEAREDLPRIIAIANDTFDDIQFTHASLEDFWAALKQSVQGKSLETVYGELRDVPRTDGSVNYLLYNVLSSRADNKLQNAKSRDCAGTTGRNPGVRYELAVGYCGLSARAFVDVAWKWLLKNHPHDSIGGCSVDEVHRQMA